MEAINNAKEEQGQSKMKSKGSSSGKKLYRGEPQMNLVSSKTFYRAYEFNNDLLTQANCD